MDTQNDIVRSVGAATPSLEMQLGRSVFATGGHLSGVLLFRVSRRTNIRSLIVSVRGCETASITRFARSTERRVPFFEREVLLSGRDRPRLRVERIARFWNEFLGRDVGRTLSAGEHVYPFSIHLPASLPPTYEGKAGKIDYSVTARLEFPLGSNIQVFKEDVLVAFVPRTVRGRPVALSYPSADGKAQPTNISINVELLQRSVELGGRITGRFVIANPRRANVRNVVVSLENCEWVRGEVQREMSRGTVQSVQIEPQDPSAGFIEGRFELRVPQDAAPTVDGTAISVIWFLKIYLDTSNPLEFKAPVTVHIPL